MGITSAILNKLGNVPSKKHKLKIFVKIGVMTTEATFKNLIGEQDDGTLLFESKLLIKLKT